jgi:hypothetical protein
MPDFLARGSARGMRTVLGRTNGRHSDCSLNNFKLLNHPISQSRFYRLKIYAIDGELGIVGRWLLDAAAHGGEACSQGEAHSGHALPRAARNEAVMNASQESVDLVIPSVGADRFNGGKLSKSIRG